jgi:hypothetical protein
LRRRFRLFAVARGFSEGWSGFTGALELHKL